MNQSNYGYEEEYEYDYQERSGSRRREGRSRSYFEEDVPEPSSSEAAMPARSKSYRSIDSYNSEEDNFVTIDGQQWDLNELREIQVRAERDGYIPPYDQPQETLSREARYKSEDGAGANTDDYKKAYNDDFTLKPKPKYEWRKQASSDKAEKPTQEEQFYQEQYQHEEQLYHEQQQQQKQQQEEMTRTMIEVFPGVEMPLRGSEETQVAITMSQIRTAVCLDCTLSLSCIEDAEYILCPLCRCVSPLVLSEKGVPAGAFGVGLGFVADGEF